MKDPVSIKRVELLHPDLRQDVINFITEAEQHLDTTFRITQGLRTIAEQDALYAQGRTRPGKIVTNARGGSSYHNYGLAIDLVEMRNGQANWSFNYDRLVPFAKKYGFYWGGWFKKIIDKPHFEKAFGYTGRELLAMEKAGKKIPGTIYLDLKR